MTIFNDKPPVDLADLKALALLREARDEEVRRTAEQEEVLAWDRAMTRAFKGIFPRSSRLIFMRAAVARAERGEDS